MWTAREASGNGEDGSGNGEDGQASIELIALLPALALIATLALQALLAGSTLWLTATAAREAARARALGGDPGAAARAALPSWSREGTRVARDGGDGIRVTVPIRSLVGGVRLGSISIPARMEPQR
jgi:pilus assembly protein CpaE